MSNWEAVIGLEVHVQLQTASKIFSGASTAYGAEPNSQACAIDLGMPGTLPVMNAGAVEMAIRFGLAIGATVAQRSVFARKNYFYPDLPKGYQISQYELPVVVGGGLQVRQDDGSHKFVQLTRAHLEEDAGKSVHDAFHAETGVDLNRAGTPLLEIVSEPVLSSAAEAVAYLKTLHTLVRWLGVSDGNMQEGSFRCDANVSVRRRGEPLGTRAEIKNVNSFRFVEKAIDYEIERQIRLIEAGGKVVQETRLFDANKGETRSMRGKESAHDYRYFPDPDLPPLVIAAEDIERVRTAMPELPAARRQRYIDSLGLPEYDATLLTADRTVSDYFETLNAAVPAQAKLCANWVLGEWTGALNANGLAPEQSPVGAARLAGLLARIVDGSLSSKMGKQVFEALWNGDESADAVIERLGLKQVSDTGALAAVVDEIIAANPKQVEQYRGGNDKLLQFFVGQAMKATKGQANPAQLNELLKAKLG
ncbi:MAG: Asp-tRNA(Asn)/Glu-tRNA(Gln) amidotransferase subunit GatB [Rhodanobacteraceae bacterium]|nr:Asp-tRNA(Asn)/Glu-tRNA(Gln) amidotransferase subunit GatB [Rhodanobacteraceae bacterium]